jgi:hypothetical protein
VQESPAEKELNLSIFLQGLYSQNGMMNPAKDESGNPVWGVNIADKITIEFHDAANYSTIVYSISNVDLHTDGTLVLTIPPAFIGNYYITIKHRNSLETVSMLPVSFSGISMFYDFTDLASKAYGNNMKILPDGRCVIYGGDANQDGIVDSGDMILLDNDASLFTMGYVVSDCNGDGLIDSSDMMIVENNSWFFITVLTP